VGCIVTADSLDPSAAGLPVTPTGPVLWWRSDTNLATRPFGVCGWADGIRGISLRPSSISRAPMLVAISGASLVALAPADVLTARDPAALAQNRARTIIVLGRHGGFTYAFVTSATNRSSLVTGLRHETTGYAYEHAAVIGRASGSAATGLAHEYLALPMDHSASTADLRINGVQRTLTDPGTPPVMAVPDRQWVGSPGSSGTIDVLEIIVYDRMLDSTQRSMVETNASSRILAAGM
jgi:hypothetical protein